MDEEVKKILKQVNRRLMNAESSIRLMEQRIDALEGTIKAMERKTGRNTKDITELSGGKAEIERLGGGGYQARGRWRKFCFKERFGSALEVSGPHLSC